MPRTREQFEEIRENRRKQILDAALETFASEGYAHSSIADIANEAEISKGLIYNYFESKEDLLIRLIEKGIEEVMHLAGPEKKGILTAAEFEQFVTKIFSEMLSNTKFWVFYISVILQPKVREKLKGKPFKNIREHFGPMLFNFFVDQGFEDPYLEMLSFSAMIEGFGVLLVYAYPDDKLPRELIRKFETRLIKQFIK